MWYQFWINSCLQQFFYEGILMEVSQFGFAGAQESQTVWPTPIYIVHRLRVAIWEPFALTFMWNSSNKHFDRLTPANSVESLIPLERIKKQTTEKMTLVEPQIITAANNEKNFKLRRVATLLNFLFSSWEYFQNFTTWDILWSLQSEGSWGPFLESPGNFSGP